MTRLAKLFAAFWLVSCALAPLASANNIASVDQSGSYSYTRFIQVGDRTRIKVRQIDPRKFERIQGHLAARVDRIAERAFARLSRSQSQNARDGDLANDIVALDQNGAGNLAVTAQIGSNDSAAIDQNGSTNASFTVQRGDNLHIATNQSGDHNITFVMQRNGHGSRNR